MGTTTAWSILLSGLLSCLLFLLSISEVNCLGCFKCTSINHSNPDCEDRFNNTNKFWEGDCWNYRKKREGMFPGTQCIKMTAEDEKSGYSVVVRDCVVDDGGTNSETEIGRLTHCGLLNTIEFDKKRMKGCILACDTDGCNMASLPATWRSRSTHFRFLMTLSVVTSVCWTYFFVLLGGHVVMEL